MEPNSEVAQLKLYACPHACSLVPHLALEYVGAHFTYEFVNAFERQQRRPEYLAISPRGKIPLLVAGETSILENVAILSWIGARFPSSGLMSEPRSTDFFSELSDLSWCASGIHPNISRFARPDVFSLPEHSVEGIREVARQMLSKDFELINERLQGREYWRDRLSLMDLYLFWLFARTGEEGMDLSPYENYSGLILRMMGLPFVQRTLARERSFLPCFEGLPMS